MQSELNCRKSTPWTTRSHVYAIGSCTLASILCYQPLGRVPQEGTHLTSNPSFSNKKTHSSFSQPNFFNKSKVSVRTQKNFFNNKQVPLVGENRLVEENTRISQVHSKLYSENRAREQEVFFIIFYKNFIKNVITFNYMDLYNTTWCHSLLNAVNEFYTRCNDRELWLSTRGYALFE